MHVSGFCGELTLVGDVKEGARTAPVCVKVVALHLTIVPHELTGALPGLGASGWLEPVRLVARLVAKWLAAGG